ncbi:hypothetical protein GF337_06690 [candidate division KSB1 bacterium]|nr:hypothetical protein [candidate division KSB1 bacterium]
MKTRFYIYVVLFLVLFGLNFCNKKSPDENIGEFNEDFFNLYVPELGTSRLLVKSDLPQHQQQFFDEANGQLQLLADLNENEIPEYFVAGVSETGLRKRIKKPYFIAVFERQTTGIKRLFFQQVFVPPVNFNLTNVENEPRVVISFAFSSDYGAEIYYHNGEFRLESW